MSEDTSTNVDQVDEESTELTEVQTFKLLFSHRLHELADMAGACSTFDSIMNDVGLPARWKFTEANVDEYGYSQASYDGPSIVTDEATDEDAARWLRRTSQVLTEATDSYGYREVYEASTGRYVRLSDVLAEWGFPTRQDIPIVIEGTFKLTSSVRGWDDANLIDNVTPYTISDAISRAVHAGDKGVQWKVSHPETDDDTEA